MNARNNEQHAQSLTRSGMVSAQAFVWQGEAFKSSGLCTWLYRGLKGLRSVLSVGFGESPTSLAHMVVGHELLIHEYTRDKLQEGPVCPLARPILTVAHTNPNS